FQGGKNAFHAPGAEYGLSRMGRQFIAGLLRHAPEYSAVTNQWVNSYKRLWGAQEAPSYICWGHNNRSALVRVPFHKPTKGTSSRVEFRGLDSSANPYLAFSVLLAAGMAGIEGEYELPEGAEDAVWDLTERERRAMGIEPLPTDLFRALEAFEGSELMASTLGEQVFEFFLRDKRQEWQRYREQLTDHELRATFPRAWVGDRRQHRAVHAHRGPRAPRAPPRRPGAPLPGRARRGRARRRRGRGAGPDRGRRRRRAGPAATGGSGPGGRARRSADGVPRGRREGGLRRSA